MPTPDEILVKYSSPKAAMPTPDEVLAKYSTPAVEEGPSLVSAQGREPGKEVIDSKPDLAKEVNVPIEEKVARRLRTEAASSLTLAPANAILGSPSTAVDKAQSLGPVGDLATTVAGAAFDPAALKLAGFAGRAASKIPGVNRLFGATEKLALARQQALAEAELGADLAQSTFKSASRSYLANKLATDAVKGAADFGGYQLAKELGTAASDGKIDPVQSAINVAKGMGLGFVTGPAGGLLSRKFGGDQTLNAATQAVTPPLELATKAEVLTPVKQMEKEIAELEKQQAKIERSLPTAGAYKQDLEEQLALKKQQIDNLAQQHAQAIDDVSNQSPFLANGQKKDTVDYLQQISSIENEHHELGNHADAIAATIKSLGPNGESPEALQAIAAISGRKSELEALHGQTIENYKGFIKESQPIKAGDLYTKQKFLDDSYHFANQQVQKLVEKNVVPADQAKAFAAEMLLKLSDDKGIVRAGRSALSKEVAQFILPLENLSRVDSTHGTLATKVGIDLITANAKFSHLKTDLMSNLGNSAKALTKKGLAPDDITHLLTYIESTPAGPVFNPAAVASKTLSRPAYDGIAGPADQMLAKYPELAQMREIFDTVRTQIPELGDRYVAGFVPIRRVSQESLGGGAASRISDPTFLQARTNGAIIPGYHETNIFKLIGTYADEVARKQAYEPLLPNVYSEVNKLFALGDRTSGNYLVRLAADTMGLGGSKEVADKFAEQLIQNNSAQIAQLLGQVEPGSHVWADIYSAAKSIMYQSLVVGNPKTLLLQAAQPELVGSGEVGYQWILRSHKEQALNSAVWKKAQSMDKMLATADAGALEEVGFQQIENRAVKAVENIITMPLRPLKKIFSRLETGNRRTMFAAGYMQAQDALKNGTFDKAVASLLPGERAAVKYQLDKNGPEAAAQLYGVMRSYRANFAYSVANRPEFLRGPIGKAIPFTTWGLNQVHRLVGDIAGLQGKQLARRIVTPLAMLGAWKAMTGYDIPGANPNDPGNLANAFRPTLFPMITAPATAFSMTAGRTGDLGAATTAAGKEALKYTPVGSYQAIAKRYEATGNPVRALVRMDELPESKWYLRALPSLLRKGME